MTLSPVRMKMLSFALLVCACSWTAEQTEVLDSFDLAVSALEGGQWSSAPDLLGSSTLHFLDSLSSDLSERGLEGYSSMDLLLENLYHEYIDFNGEVTMIFIDGSTAEITVSGRGDGGDSFAGSRRYRMILEAGEWKLDLGDDFRASIAEALRGSYTSS